MNIKVDIQGPFGWPNYEDSKPVLPTKSGVYITCFAYEDSYIPWGVGVTKRKFRTRFMEHTTKFINGDYNILNYEKAIQARRQLAWKGWTWTEEKKAIFLQNKAEILKDAVTQLISTYIFIIELEGIIRLERLESALVDNFHSKGNILIDTGMMLSRRWHNEEIINVSFNRHSIIHQLPMSLTI
ncbi:hypothetical protein [Ferrovum sp. PN-J185]|uniref:hypothetical protein n=1 Tax=Ferrovum sp. PN-J185 TaxID=1356306 RepID=UPI0007981CEC|nr:hypothetical protein [Ferrovum sp. PN-J185]KXW55483.1 hypothetical protein FV185_12500 [Ferrovum sp. PN-J185]